MSAGIETNESRGEALREAMGPESEDEYSYPPSHGPVQYLLRDGDGDESVLTFRELVEYFARGLDMSDEDLDEVRLLSAGESVSGEFVACGSPSGWTLTRLGAPEVTYRRIPHAAHYWGMPGKGHDLELWHYSQPAQLPKPDAIPADAEYHHGQLTAGVQVWTYLRRAPLTGPCTADCGAR